MLVAAGALAASTNAASGRAVMNWFGSTERGLALGIRQANVPLGGLVAALVLPLIGAAAGVDAAYFALAAACAAGALAGALLLRDRPRAHAHDSRPEPRSRPLRTRALWLVSWGSALIVVGQIATMSFTVLFLHEGRGFSTGAAALVLATQQVIGATLRVVAGHWSDRFGSRIAPLSRLALGVSCTLVAVAAFASAPSWLLVPVIVAAGAIGLSWNGLSFVAAAEIAGNRASGAAIGFQQTVLGVAGIGAPIGFAALVATTSWRLAFLVSACFPLLGWAVLRPLRGVRRLSPG